MKKIVLILILALIPIISYASSAGDFTVNRQSTYAVPRDVNNILALDLTLPEPPAGGTLQLKSIKIHNAGSATHLDFSKLMIWEDGSSAGFDGDEIEVVRILSAPFFDTAFSGTFRSYTKTSPWRRIFFTLDTTSVVYTYEGMSIQLELAVNSLVFSDTAFNGPTDKSVIGFERDIVFGVSVPAAPAAPIAGAGKAISASTIRWYFTELSDNEFGFKILDGNLKEVARVEQANLSYLDETGLQPATEYSGRKVVAFNDKGESAVSTVTVFTAVRTLAEQKTTSTEEVVKEEVKEETKTEEVVPVPEKSLLEQIQDKIAEIQRQINELIIQLNELIKQSAATVIGALRGFFQSFFGR